MTSIHESVSCNYCRRNNFRGLRYKCLICNDYDLCPVCYEGGSCTSRHTVSHPMQCVVSRNDYDLFYSGESISSEQPQSLTCPLCGRLGFTDSTLLDHVTSDHISSDKDEPSAGVVCPICGIETNQLTYDFATHLTMEHRTLRDQNDRVPVRGRGIRCGNGLRTRRPQPQYNPVGNSTGSTSARDSNDPLVEIIASLSGVRRAGNNSSLSPASQLQHLQMHLQSSPPFAARATSDHEVRIMRRLLQTMNNQINPPSTSTSSNTAASITGTGNNAYSTASTHYRGNQSYLLKDQSSLGNAAVLSATGTQNGSLSGPQPGSLASQLSGEDSSHPSQYLLPNCMKPILTEAEQLEKEILKADRSLFVQELLFQAGLLDKSTC